MSAAPGDVGPALPPADNGLVLELSALRASELPNMELAALQMVGNKQDPYVRLTVQTPNGPVELRSTTVSTPRPALLGPACLPACSGGGVHSLAVEETGSPPGYIGRAVPVSLLSRAGRWAGSRVAFLYIS
jgi:hypothetical protein